MMNRPLGKLGFVVVLTAISILCATLALTMPGELALEVVRWITKPWVLLLLGIGIYYIGDLKSSIWGSREKNLRTLGVGLFVCLLAAVLVLREPVGFRVLNDEYVIGAQAKRLHEAGLSDFPLRTAGVYDDLFVLDSQVDKRPPLFSVALSLVHDLLGYRVSNAFLLNHLIGAMVLFLLGVLAWRKDRSLKLNFMRLFLLAMIVLSYREFALNMTGGGLDLMNLLILIAAILSARNFVQNGTSSSLALWVIVSVLLVNTRHESILYLTSFAAVYLFLVWKQREWIVHWSLFLIPFGVLFYLLRFRAFSMYPDEYMQLAAGESMFSTSNFFSNLGHAVDYLFIPGFSSTSSFLVSGVGLVGVLLFLIRVFWSWRKRAGRDKTQTLLLAYGFVVFLNFGILLMYHWGTLNDPEVSRLSMPVVFIFGLGCYYVIAPLLNGRYSGVVIVGLFVVVFSSMLPWKTPDIHRLNNYYHRIDDHARSMIEKSGFQNVCVVTDRPLYWYLHGHASVNAGSLRTAAANLSFHERAGSFEVVIMETFQRNPLTMMEFGSSIRTAGFSLETEVLGEFSFKPFHFSRVHRLHTMASADSNFGITVLPSETYNKSPVESWFYHLP